ncbi:MAG: TIGR03560 family F420-dependent LLM class oxidoreductase [Acidimicrobiales bacterium]|nr:TIGR03560 family F420-dependent LLM class oxidoreductase [Acidimicrobiales bacterium]
MIKRPNPFPQIPVDSHITCGSQQELRLNVAINRNFSWRLALVIHSGHHRGIESSEPIRIPSNALVILAGPSGAGKSVWAEENFTPEQIISTDAMRAIVGLGEHDQRAGTDAFDLVNLIVERRLKRGLLTVVDSLGMDPKQRARWLKAAAKHNRPTLAIAFDTAAKECRARNKARTHSVPPKVLTSQIDRWPEQRQAIQAEVHQLFPAQNVRVIPPTLAGHETARRSQQEKPVTMKFGLTISSFTFAEETADLAPRLADLAVQAEAVGFDSLWVMDHFIQIPQVGRQWDPMMESYTTLAFLAAATERISLGTLVTGITYRNIAHLAKTVATLDLLSGGRARCGLGAAWFEAEHHLYGYEFPPIGERYAQLEDALQLLPLMWGPGTPSFVGSTFSTDAATCYPRPLQEKIPILVGGSGEKKTLKLVAEYADACNLFGEPDVIAHKVGVLEEHCRSFNRDPAEIAVTQLSTVQVGSDDDDLAARVGALSPADVPFDVAAAQLNAGTTDDHIGRFRALADAGVDEVVVSLADLALPGAVANFGPVIQAFR